LIVLCVCRLSARTALNYSFPLSTKQSSVLAEPTGAARQ